LALATVEGRDRQRCGECSFVLYLNPASAAAGVVIDDSQSVLLIRRKIPPYQGDWALPAGYQEIDEDPRDTVCREVVEETGITVEVSELLDVLFVPDDPRKPANVTVFLCRPVGGSLQAGSDASSAAWFPLDDLPPNLGFENNALILARFLQR